MGAFARRCGPTRAGPALLFTRSLHGRAVRAREASAGRAAERAAELLGGLDILEEQSETDAERLELTAKVLEAASQTAMDEKIEALARVLAEGLGPDGDVDEATVLPLALRDLEGSHVTVLRVMATPRRVDGDGRAEPEYTSRDGELREIRDGAGVRVFEAVLAVLVRHGLVTDHHDRGTWATIEAARWNITDVGLRCLVLLGHEVPGVRPPGVVGPR